MSISESCSVPSFAEASRCFCLAKMDAMVSCWDHAEICLMYLNVLQCSNTVVSLGVAKVWSLGNFQCAPSAKVVWQLLVVPKRCIESKKWEAGISEDIYQSASNRRSSFSKKGVMQALDEVWEDARAGSQSHFTNVGEPEAQPFHKLYSWIHRTVATFSICFSDFHQSRVLTHSDVVRCSTSFEKFQKAQVPSSKSCRSFVSTSCYQVPSLRSWDSMAIPLAGVSSLEMATL